MFNTDAGKRVLSRISAICDGQIIHPAQADKPGLMAFRAGQRYVMHMINLSFAGRGAPATPNEDT